MVSTLAFSTSFWATPHIPPTPNTLGSTRFEIQGIYEDGVLLWYYYATVDFYGEFDFSGTTIAALCTPGARTHISKVELSNCEGLWLLDFLNQPYCTQARALNCPNLRGVNLSGAYTDIEVQPRLFSRPVRLNTLGSGTVSFVYGESGTEIGGENETGSVGAQGENFLGWYSEGSIHSAEADFEITDGISATACFAGDINADGSITMQDAVAALRAAVGVTDLNDLDFAMADVDCSGSIGIPDALAIARLCMGIL